MAQLRRDHDKFVRRGAQIIVIGAEDAAAFAHYWEENRLPFLGLPDPNHSVLKLYGQEVNLFRLGRMPAQVVVDRQGIARYIHYGHSMEDIPGSEEILQILDSLEPAPA
jgi:peroxiredoxin Q/BCP